MRLCFWLSCAHMVLTDTLTIEPFSPLMDESIYTSPLESNLNRLISDQFSHWQTQFKIFLSFTDLVKELEEEKCQEFDRIKSENLPLNCGQWIKTTLNCSADFVALFSSDFRPKLSKELEDIELEQRDALKLLKEAQNNVKQVSEVISKNLNEILIYFKRKDRTVLNDPWINELSIRHFSAKFLDIKTEYLVKLHRIYTQIRHLHTELNHKLSVYSDEFLRILERFGLAPTPESNFTDSTFNPPLNTTTSTTPLSDWETVLKNYSLDYDWKLTCPPLDGFLSTLYNHLKSLGVEFSIETGGNVPKIFSENFLRFGFLQKLISGILTRNWQVSFAILQPSTGFLHLYKVNNKGIGTNSGVAGAATGIEGNLLVPSVSSSTGNLNSNNYTKSYLHDLNLLATQFYLQSPHQPAAISSQTLSPFLSIPIGSNCKIVASDPITFSFLIKPAGGEKVNLKAFCEEEFVDWVIFLNETVKRTRGNNSIITKSPQNHPVNISHQGENEESPNQKLSNYPTTSSSSSSSSSADSQNIQTTTTATTSTSTFSSVAAQIVDLENPWE